MRTVKPLPKSLVEGANIKVFDLKKDNGEPTRFAIVEFEKDDVSLDFITLNCRSDLEIESQCATRYQDELDKKERQKFGL